MQKTSIWKRLSKFLAVLLCVSMVLQYAVPMVNATADTGTEAETDTSTETVTAKGTPVIDLITFDEVDEEGNGLITPFTVKAGTVKIVQDGDNNVMQVHSGARAQYSGAATLNGGYIISGRIQMRKADVAYPNITYWPGAATTKTLDNYIVSEADGWQYFEVPIYWTNYTLLQFIFNAGGYAYWLDDVQVSEMNDYYAWKMDSDTWEANSMMVSKLPENPEPIGENLLTNGDFAVTDAAADGFAWTSNNTTTTVTTADGYLRSEYNSTDYRVISTLTQNNVAVEPGAVYQVKFNYRITESNEPDATWYGPYVQLSNSDKFLRIRASDAETGLNTSGEWTEFAYTFIMPDGGSSLKFTINSWLYENDWCEVDDIALYKVADAAAIKLELADRFFYLDEAKTTFTATLRDTSKAAETVTFTVYNGKDVLWTKDATFANNAAQVEFDFSALTLKTDGTPYVVMATLGDTVVTEEIFFSPRPATLDADGNFVKDGEIVKVNIAWAIDRNEIKEGVVTDYEKVAEIGANVMALGSIKSVEQALQMLDYCESFGYLGFLQMNWGLYNKDIETKTKTLIEVVSDERIQNHPALLGYCLTDEPWSWGAEDQVAENLADGYRLIRRFDKKNVIFSINNMEQYHGLTTHYSDVLVVDHYEAPAGGKVYTKVLKAVEAADAAEMPVWAVVGAYKQDDYFPTADQVRNEVWQALLAGADGLGYYSISYGGGYNASGNGVAIWEYKDAEGNPVGQQLWEGMQSFNEKEWDIAFDYFVLGNGSPCVRTEMIELSDGYMYHFWKAADGKYYLIALNTKADETSVSIPVSLYDENNKALGHFTAKVVNGSDQDTFHGEKSMQVALEANQAVLYEITSNTKAVYVASSEYGGNDETGDGTIGAPYLTIRKAYEHLYNNAPGATAEDNVIVVMDMLGAESLPINASSNRVMFSRGTTSSTVLGDVPATITGWADATEDPGLTFAYGDNYTYADLILDNLVLNVTTSAPLRNRGQLIINSNVTTVDAAAKLSIVGGAAGSMVINGGTWNMVAGSTGAFAADVSVGGNAVITTLAAYSGATQGAKVEIDASAHDSKLEITGGTINTVAAAYAQCSSTNVQSIKAGTVTINMSDADVTYLYPAGNIQNAAYGSVNIAKTIVNIADMEVGRIYLGQAGTEEVQSAGEVSIAYNVDKLPIYLQNSRAASLKLDLPLVDLEFTQEQVAAIAAGMDADAEAYVYAYKARPIPTGYDEAYRVTVTNNNLSASYAAEGTITLPMKQCAVDSNVYTYNNETVGDMIESEVVDHTVKITANLGTFVVDEEYEHTPGKSVVTAPTCAEPGYTTYTCSVCFAKYVADEVPATGEHTYIDGVCSDCGAKEPAEEVTGTITANGHSLSLEGNIWINKYVIIEGFEGVDLTKDAGLLIWTSEIAEEDAVFGTGNPIVKEGLLYNGLYGGKPEYGQLTDGIKAPFYGNKLYMRVYVKVGETYHYGAFTAYSVEDYCRGRIQKSSDAALKTLCAAVLEYGAMAQIRFSNVEGVNTEVLVNEGLDSSLKTEFSEEMIVALDTEYETKITAADTAIVSANGRSISLNEGLLINYYFKTTLTNIQSAELLTWDKEVEGELTYENATKTALTYAGGEYAASGALVPAPYCGDTIYACARFVDAEGTEYYTAVDAYSTHKYAENQFAKANLTEANRNLLEALIVYSHLANTKFAK